jgi:small-conductance mechanosensitive channel
VAGDAPSTSLTKNLAQLVVVLIGFLILLNHLGVDIRPLLTALGVGGLAVALALQDTLSNLFSGFYITVAGQIRMGHYIKLNTGEEGYITDITWRSTTLRTQSNNFIIVPNAKLAQAIVTNYNLPEKRIGISVTVGVAYGSDPARVQAILVEEAIAGAATIEGLLAEPSPGAVLSPGFGDFALQFTLGVNVSDFSDQARVQSELRARILKRFALEGIEMPYPTQTLLLKQLPS